MLTLRAALAALALAPLLPAPAAPPVAPGGEHCRAAADARSPDLRRELFFAVLEGLYEDGVENDVVDALLQPDPETGSPMSFVWGCPICMPSFDALRLYRARPRLTDKLERDTFGPGLAPVVRERLLSSSFEERQRALEPLVRSWVERRMARLRLDDAERAIWRREIETRAKDGMGQLAMARERGWAGALGRVGECALCRGAESAVQ
jgi:hypothetical protein